MNNMRLTKILVLIILFLSVSKLTIFAEEIGLVSNVDKTVLTTADSINLTITVEGSANTPQPQLPSLEGFNLIFGPSVSARTTIVNGAVSVSRGYTYVLKPLSAGKFTIGAFTLQYNGKVYESNTINIEVLDKADNARLKDGSEDLNLSEKIFVEFVTDKNEAYTYEQVVLTFRFFYQRGLPIADLEYVEPDTKNFIKEDMGKQRQYEVIRNGIIYNVIELKTALFPVVAGSLQIMPAKVRCNLLVKSGRRSSGNFFGNPFFDDFFGDQQKYPVIRETDSIALPVKPMPEEGKPANFSGAVGVYSLEAEAKPAKVNVGDPVTITMKIKGRGNIQSISEPLLQILNKNDFRVYPSETDTAITDRNEGINGEKIFRKVIEPQNAEVAQTPGISFSFFNPESGEYKTISHDPIPVEVEAGEIEAPIRLYVRETDTNKEQSPIITKDIFPIMTNLADFTDQGKLLYKSPGLFAIFFAPIIAVAVSIFAQRRRNKLKTDVSYARNRRAQSKARKRLIKVKKFMKDTASEECYSTLSNTITEYLADKLNTTSASITPNSAAKDLEMRNVQKETVDKLIELLDLCDYGRFARDADTKKMIINAINSAEELISSLEKQLR